MNTSNILIYQTKVEGDTVIAKVTENIMKLLEKISK